MGMDWVRLWKCTVLPLSGLSLIQDGELDGNGVWLRKSASGSSLGVIGMVIRVRRRRRKENDM
jgi:hypothetical protein